MNRRNKRIISYFILFSLLIIIGVAFAILQANLQINGTAKISENQWNVHFENIVVSPESVPIGTGDTAATIDPTNNCKVDFSVTLSLPGDFYEFTVDVANDGTIDGMIDTLTKTLKVNNIETETAPNYLNYSVTYDDGTEILENHLLAKSTSETYKVRVEFKTDIDEEDLPDTTTLSMTVEPVFIQADTSTAVLRNYKYYAVTNTKIYFSQEIPNSVNLRNTPEEAIPDWLSFVDDNKTRPFYLDLNVSNNYVTSARIEVVISDEIAQENPGLKSGTYSFVGGDNGAAYNDNANLLKNIFDYDNYPTRCSVKSTFHNCEVGSLGIVVYSNGTVWVTDREFYLCNIDNYNTSSIYATCEPEYTE